MKKLLSFISTVSLIVSTSNSVISCGVLDGNNNKKISLSSVILNSNLDKIANNSASTILATVKLKNSQFETEHVQLTNITKTTATIVSKNDGYYIGNVTVTFTIKEENIEQIDKVLVGYYYDWGGTGQVKPSFQELANTRYNVIDVSFLYSSSAYQMPIYQPINAYEVKEGIKLLHSKGKKVLISMGGATGSEMRFRTDQKDQLKNTILSVVNDYGFDGLDIDWEGGCLSDRISQKVTIDALKEIKDANFDFIITMAPEMPYLKNNTEDGSKGSYIPFLKGLDKYYNWINPQFYNGWAFGTYVEQEEAKKFNLPYLSNISNDDLEHRAEFYYMMTKYMTTTYSSNNDFYLINPERFVLGASTNELAGRGAATEEAIKKSYQWLSEDGIYTKGLMTWAVNYDVYEGTLIINGQVVNWKKWSYESWFNETHGKENKSK
ncbi:glycosyl hydrolase family 18 protein [Spiroplasma floricola]|uniref:Chitinase n=1 Tax=Spiroplasma floricola 23-6 TaxID=1336749 RepID=A0A2K8SDG9_9MOLU|nr:glycosyl hydrolase family 18 protein [Spiroplasma floricola]AUB31506.1 chitinase [Spiroplasma floricola 23-6]